MSSGGTHALTPASTADVDGVWLARRVLPADPSLVRLVMGVKLTWWGRFRGLQSTAVKRIAAREFPVTLTIVSVDAHGAAMEAKFKAMAGARLK